jgi:hypothetical protein
MPKSCPRFWFCGCLAVLTSVLKRIFDSAVAQPTNAKARFECQSPVRVFGFAAVWLFCGRELKPSYPQFSCAREYLKNF